jgi:hypothetical protein
MDKIPSYKKVKGSKGISGIGGGVKAAPKADSKDKAGSINPSGVMDSRPSPDDPVQSAR